MSTNAESSAPAASHALAAWLGLAIVLVSVLSKLWLAWAFPTLPVSDFKRIVEFAGEMASSGFAPRTWHWTLLNPGTSALLAPLLALFPAGHETVARVATTLLVGFLPALPLLMLRRSVPAWTRLLAATGLAVLPALWVFSPVVAQDNWVMAPTLALACLAVDNVYRWRKGRPVAAAVLFSLAVYIRQEMLVAALPLAAVATWSWDAQGRRLGHGILAVAIAAVLLFTMAFQRHVATDRFALTSDHGGASMLGSYVPGAGFGWIPYESYVASVDPALSRDTGRMMKEAGGLAWREIERRPLFHLERRTGALLYALSETDGTLTYWSLQDDAQIDSRRQAATALASTVQPWVRATLVLLHALFVGAAIVGWRRRDAALIAIALLVAFKCAIHVVFATQARFFLVVSALEIIAVALALLHVFRNVGLRRVFALSTGVALVVLAVATAALPRWEKRLAEPSAPAPSLFVLQTTGAVVRCEVTGGKLLSSAATTFSFQTAHGDPAPGEIAEIHCGARARKAGATLRFELNDRYAPGGFPDRMFQEVVVDGRMLRRHDIAAKPGNGWWPFDVPLAVDRDHDVIVRVRALRPDPGPAWGDAAASDVRIADVASMEN